MINVVDAPDFSLWVVHSRGAYNRNEVTVKGFRADNINHQWREETLEFHELQTEVKLTYYSSPNELPGKELAMHTLEIEISGEKQAREDTIKKLEGITGIKIPRK
jgi:hypothetical protein